MSENEYQCAMCNGIFTKGWSEQEARAETQSYWPDTPQEECEVICDDCWQKVHPETHSVEYAESLYDQAREKEYMASEYIALVTQAITKVHGVPPSILGRNDAAVEGTLREAPLQIEREAGKHE